MKNGERVTLAVRAGLRSRLGEGVIIRHPKHQAAGLAGGGRMSAGGKAASAGMVFDKAAKKNLGIGKSKADAADLPLWLEETGPTSCPGTNDTSLTNASALWAADYTLYAATLGVERMAMHSMLGACNGGAPMSLICDPAEHGDRSNSFRVRPNMLGLRLLAPSLGGQLLELMLLAVGI